VGSTAAAMMQVTWWGYYDCPDCGGSVSNVQCPTCFKRAEDERKNIKTFSTADAKLKRYGDLTNELWSYFNSDILDKNTDLYLLLQELDPR
jgi:hypothetical protein